MQKDACDWMAGQVRGAKIRDQKSEIRSQWAEKEERGAKSGFAAKTNPPTNNDQNTLPISA